MILGSRYNYKHINVQRARNLFTIPLASSQLGMPLSTRGRSNAAQLSIAWCFCPPHTYDPFANPSGLISFATAENWPIQPALHAFASTVSVSHVAFRYVFSTGGGPRLPFAFARHFNEFFHPSWEIRGEDVMITAAATSLHDVLAYSLADEGEGVLVSRPYYGRFEIDFGNKARVRVVSVDTDHEECFSVNVVKAYEMALAESEGVGVRIRAVLVVNPHNPLGHCYPRETLIALMRFCQQKDLHFISDEVYALSVFDNPDFPDATPFASALSIDTTGVIDPGQVHAIYGLSKDFGAAGLKVGCLITRNEGLKSAVTAVQRFCGVSGPSVAVATAMLEDRNWCRGFIDLSRKRLAEAYLFIVRRLREVGIQFMEGGNAAFFVWVDLSPWLPPDNEDHTGREREQVLAQKFVDNGVFLQPGEEHGRVGWFRLVFSMDECVVEEGLRRIKKTVQEVSW